MSMRKEPVMVGCATGISGALDADGVYSEPMSPEFMPEYHRLLAATKPVAAPGPRERPAGSFGALADTYFGSPEVRSKRPSTQKMYRLVIEPLTEKAGSAP